MIPKTKMKLNCHSSPEAGKFPFVLAQKLEHLRGETNLWRNFIKHFVEYVLNAYSYMIVAGILKMKRAKVVGFNWLILY
jgi:hypothetical protein